MADDLENRTEPATPRRKQEEREKGNVAKSQDLNTAAILLAALVLLYFFGGAIMTCLMEITSSLLGSLGTADLTIGNIRGQFAAGAVRMIIAMAPLLIGLFVVAVAVNLCQVGFLVSGEPMAPNLHRLNPAIGLKRIFSKRGAVRLAANFLKFAAVAAVLYLTVMEYADRVFPIMESDVGGIFSFIAHASFTLGIRMALVFLVLALCDLIYQKWQHEQDLRMTRQEVIDEMKRHEGDPKTKERRMRIQREIARQRMMHKVRQADVVITNPTHLACAIQYDQDAMNAPVLVAKGAGTVAQKIRDAAAEHGIPIVEKRHLAQAIYKSVPVGGETPADLYQAVAEILAYVYQLRGRKSA